MQASHVLVVCRASAIVLALVLVAIAAPAALVSAQTLPAPPQQLVDTTMPPPCNPAPGGCTIHVANNTAEFQAALTAAKLGDEIVLIAGVPYQGPFTLTSKSLGSGWIVIRSSKADPSLPPAERLPDPGIRVGPSDAPKMPKIVGGGSPHIAVETSGAAHHYRFIGIEFMPTPGAFATSLIRFGAPSTGTETSLSQLPHDLIIDRCYVHGHPGEPARRGVALNSKDAAVIESYFSEWKEVGSDGGYAIGSFNGPGPYKIVNNYLEAAGINILFGGDGLAIEGLVASDIEIQRNHFFKQPAWKDVWTVKNLLELKSAQRVVVEGNLFENNWAASDTGPGGQAGTSISFSLRNQNNTTPWVTLQDIAFKNNWVTNVSGGLKVTGADVQTSGAVWPTQGTHRVLIENNVFEDLGAFGASGKLFEVYNPPSHLVIRHNTGFPTHSIMWADITAPGHPKGIGFYFQHNITLHGTYGVKGSGLSTGTTTLNANFEAGYVFSNNVIVAGNANSYPAGNHFPGTVDEVQFEDYAGGNYRLKSTSLYKNGAPGPKDIEADIDAILCAIAGSCGGGGDQTPPTVSITNPANGSTVSGTINVTATASDNVGVVGVQFKLDGANLGAEDTAAPYEIAWDTNTATPGSHTVTAVARDAAGNTATSSVTVIVNNDQPDTTPPMVSITEPANGATVSGTITVKATASDNVGVVGVQFKLDGANLGAEDLNAPYEVAWNTVTAAPGNHTLTAVARDAAGNQTTSAAVTVTVTR